MKKEVQDLIKISHYVAGSKAYIQGGGGNTSVKIDDAQMMVKASGCKLSDMGEKEGYVLVDYRSIKDYFAIADVNNIDFEKQSADTLKSSLIKMEGIKPLRPSVEAGFHSSLKKYVIHSHSVYTNILCCSKEGKGIAEKIFTDIHFAWLPYVNPGAELTLAIAQEINKLGKIPDAIFLENHGVIVTSDNAEKAIELHEAVNDIIKEYFGITKEFPEILLKIDDDLIKSGSSYVKTFFTNYPKDLTMLKDKVLYPDQLVYLNSSVFKKDGAKSDIYFDGSDLYYTIAEKQAAVNEETLVAYLYVIETIEKLGLELVTMTYEQQAFILGWESEEYRKAMIK